jgi:hypothetical protein
MPDANSELLHYATQVRGALAEADWLWALLIQNKGFEQKYGGGVGPIEGEWAAAALTVVGQLKAVAEKLGATAAALESVLSSS